MAKKKKIKKQVYYFLIFIALCIALAIYGKNKYDEYLYQQTYEYKLEEHGYTKSDVETLLETFKEDKDRDFFLENPQNDNYLKIINEKYFLLNNFYKYIEYLNNNPKENIPNIIRTINIHLDSKFYELNLETDINKDTSMLVNKYYLLTKDYEPTDLVNIPGKYAWGENRRTRKIVYDAFLEMWKEANKAGHYLMVNSAYRTYEEQEIVYNNYKKQGTKYADSYAARPGASEHQTGLALDIFSKYNTNRKTFTDSEEAKWLKENAHNFGFLLRYPPELDDITGYSFESWHYRYVGKELATYIYNNNITFDEYYAYFIEKGL